MKTTLLNELVEDLWNIRGDPSQTWNVQYDHFTREAKKLIRAAIRKELKYRIIIPET